MPKPLLKMTKPQATAGKKPVVKLKTAAVAVKPAKAKVTPDMFPGPLYYNQQGELDLMGLYDRDGAMVRVTAPPIKVTLQKEEEKKRTDTAAARRAGFAK